MTTPVDTQFVVWERGTFRDLILASFREGLRTKTNPDTGQIFTEDEIRTVTQRDSRFYIEADAIDIAGLAIQQRAITMANNIRIEGSNSQWLLDYHLPTWGESQLPASGGGGQVEASASPGTIWQGSTTVPDPSAVQGTDPNGQRFQVLLSAVTPASGVVTLTVVGIDTGEDTNIEAGTEITWSANVPLTAAPTGETIADFSGGTDQESNEDTQERLRARIRRKPGNGNNSHIRSAVRAVSNAVEDAFVYACAMHAGSTYVAITQKRANVVGPLARIPSIPTLQFVTDFLVPPGSSTIPQRAFFLVGPPVAESCDMVQRLTQRVGSASGWKDTRPWPILDTASLAAPAEITAVTDQQNFQVTTEAGSLPGGVASLSGLSVPSIMVWDVDTSRFEQIFPASVTESAPGVFDVVLTAPPVSHTLAIGDYISPYAGLNERIAEAVEEFFDSLGPGELIPLDGTDVRATRAFRVPTVSEGYAQQAGQGSISYVTDALGGAVSGALVHSATPDSPSLPADPTDGPSMLVLGRFAIYKL